MVWSLIMAYKESYFAAGFLNTPKRTAPAMEPTINATMYMKGFPIVAITNTPPCGARNVHPNNIDNAPATPDPKTQDGITWIGSPAAYGMAASEMKQSPIIAFTGADLRSLSVNLFLNSQDAIAMAIGGTIPPTITAAIIWNPAVVS